MQRSVNSLIGYTISAKDGLLGKVNEFYFDDLTWSVRYLVVDTGNWLTNNKVLIPHSALGLTDWDSRTFIVNLTVEQVRNSPNIETEKTVTRQHEIDMLNHYGLPFYWVDILYDGPLGIAPFEPMIDITTGNQSTFISQKSNDDPHLRSTESIKGYYINANDGEIGHVEDYIVDDGIWKIRFLVVDTHNWLPGKKVLVMMRWINRIDWAEEKVYVNLSQETVKNSPEFDSTKEIVQDYEKILFNYYKEHMRQVG